MDIKHLERILKALANKRRLTILSLLKRKGELNVGEIARQIKLSYKATSKHLVILDNVDLVVGRQISLEVHYRLVRQLPSFVNSLIAKL